ncbi:hypothetical protein FB451DRAFT_1183099 [Mycena latifolia]|nr:hypothetical protein FB451DRAFT_1183099 [Mycena latifolia]
MCSDLSCTRPLARPNNPLAHVNSTINILQIVKNKSWTCISQRNLKLVPGGSPRPMGQDEETVSALPFELATGFFPGSAGILTAGLMLNSNRNILILAMNTYILKSLDASENPGLESLASLVFHVAFPEHVRDQFSARYAALKAERHLEDVTHYDEASGRIAPEAYLEDARPTVFFLGRTLEPPEHSEISEILFNKVVDLGRRRE